MTPPGTTPDSADSSGQLVFPVMQATSSFVYVAKYQLGNLTKVMLAVGLGLGITGFFIPEGVYLTAAGFALAATLAVIYIPMVVRGVVGLRVDEKGIFFGGRPLIYRRSSRFVPWEAISQVYVFRVLHLGLRGTYVGLQGVDDEVAPMSPVLSAHLAETIWHVPTNVVLSSRPALGWRLDTAALKTAVGYFAPSVPVVDLSEVLPIQMQHTRIVSH